MPWFNPVVGETSDAYLNDMGGLHVRPEHAVEAIRGAAGGAVEEGCVGAGVGTSAFGFKGGIGTASRMVELGGESGTIGALVQSNFGGRLAIDGVAMSDLQSPAPARRPRPSPSLTGGSVVRGTQDAPGSQDSQDSQGDDPLGASIMIIVATDLPLSNRLLNRVAKRATLGMARAGGAGGHGSGDYVIAFSTTYRIPDTMPGALRALAEDESAIDAAFQAVTDATEEAILNSLFRARTVVGRDGNRRDAIPLGAVLERLRCAGRIS